MTHAILSPRIVWGSGGVSYRAWDKYDDETRVRLLLRTFNMLEAICLYDKVTVLLPVSPPTICSDGGGAPDEDSLYADQFDILFKLPGLHQIAEKEGIIQRIYGESWLKTVTSGKNRQAVAEGLGIYKPGSGEVDEVTFELSFQLGYSSATGHSYVPDFEELPALAGSKEFRFSINVAHELQGAYDALSSSLSADIDALRKRGRRVGVFIPPIPAIILSKISTPQEIAEAALEVRENLAPLRKAFHVYEQTVKDDSLPLRESLSALRSLESIASALSKRYERHDVLSMTEWRDVFNIVPKDMEDLDETGLNEGKILKFLLGLPVKRLTKFLRNRRILYLLRLRERFLNIREYGTLIQKVYGFEISNSQVASFREISERVDACIDTLSGP